MWAATCTRATRDQSNRDDMMWFADRVGDVVKSGGANVSLVTAHSIPHTATGETWEVELRGRR
ncbi:hypothetical protein A6048_12520 [Dietzia psychralcaliphila]|uniref:Uncharacterized protein n=1 Tax=Dietzia psychralcaliphila TaxID=139021 RepID=A0AAD0NN49_9ACTN|nr:hypothetical protein A6048_12520 [Dietzia psychralcaliphila]